MFSHNFTFVEWVILFALSLILPLSIFSGRGNIRKRRLAVLSDLEEKVFKRGKEKYDGALPFIEVVRARYTDSSAPEGNRKTILLINSYAREILAFFLPTFMFVIISTTGFFLLFSAIDYSFKDPSLIWAGFRSAKDIPAYQLATALIVAAAFLGSYIWSINYLILRIANFDLTPVDFLRVSSHILLTTFIAVVLRHVADASTGLELATAAILLLAFMMGLYPSLGLTALVDRLPPSLRIKRVITEANQISRELPLDLVDGIDYGIKFRLANYEINDVQNLATENPISLYVSTPYNLLQILDWVAQAQLLVAVGPNKYLELRKKSIRDVVGLLDVGHTPQGRTLLKPVLLDAEAADEVVAANLESIGDAAHVRRLLHIREVVMQSMIVGPRRSDFKVAAE